MHQPVLCFERHHKQKRAEHQKIERNNTSKAHKDDLHDGQAACIGEIFGNGIEHRKNADSGGHQCDGFNSLGLAIGFLLQLVLSLVVYDIALLSGGALP